MTDKLVQDFYMLHYVYYFNAGTQRGEGNVYLATTTGAGVRKMDIDDTVDQIIIGLSNSMLEATDFVVVPTGVFYLTSCTSEEFHASKTLSDAP